MINMKLKGIFRNTLPLNKIYRKGVIYAKFGTSVNLTVLETFLFVYTFAVTAILNWLQKL